MKVSFLSQGLGETYDKPVGKLILESLEQEAFKSFTAYVAFLSDSLAIDLVDALETFLATPGRQARLFVGVDLEGTSEAALQVLLKTSADVSIIYTPSDLIFHPKVYLFQGEENRVIIGSSNLTHGGWFRNIESSVMIEFQADDHEGQALLAEITGFYGADALSANVVRLDEALIARLVAARIVPDAAHIAEIRRQRRQPQPSTDHQAAMALITEIFPALPSGRVPSRRTRTATMRCSARKHQAPARTHMDARSFWIETGPLTSGSRNQLDLSMVASNSDTGALQLFKVDPNLRVERTITLRFQGRDFAFNTIKYPATLSGESNGTWRLQMNGKSEDGSSLTPISREYFRNAVLIFTELNPDHYQIEVQPKSMIPNLILQSIETDRNRGTNGRSFGLLVP